MGKQYTYVCSAACIPSCEFTWKYMGKTFKGDQVQIPILRQRDNTFSSQREVTFSDYSKLKPLTCEATNTVSHATITATKGPHCHWWLYGFAPTFRIKNGISTGTKKPSLHHVFHVHAWCFECSLCKDPISVRPTSRALPVSGKSFSLQCVGSQDPESITWLKNKHPIPASERVHFSPGNISMTFSPLLQADEGF